MMHGNKKIKKIRMYGTFRPTCAQAYYKSGRSHPSLFHHYTNIQSRISIPEAPGYVTFSIPLPQMIGNDELYCLN